MTDQSETPDPKPGDWVLIRAKVLERSMPESALVELFSKTDQYPAHVRLDLIVSVVPPPLPVEPTAPGAVVMVGPEDAAQVFMRQRLRDGGWRRTGSTACFPWSEVCAYGEVQVLYP